MGNPQFSFLLNCPTYESYLDTFVKHSDKYYLRNDLVSRMLVTLGYRTTGVGLYTTKQFERLKTQILEQLFPRKKSHILYSYGSCSLDPVIRGLAQRELPNVQKAISTIIFVKYRNKSGFDISGFIDYEHSLRHANKDDEDFPNWSGIFTERVKLRPSKHDLSFYDWHRNLTYFNNSDNFIVNHDRDHGLLFMHRGDHKKICVDISNELFNMNSEYTMINSKKYGQVIFFDHVIRKKI